MWIAVGLGILAVVVLGVGFFRKNRMLMLAGWMWVIASVGAGVVGI